MKLSMLDVWVQYNSMFGGWDVHCFVFVHPHLSTVCSKGLDPVLSTFFATLLLYVLCLKAGLLFIIEVFCPPFCAA